MEKRHEAEAARRAAAALAAQEEALAAAQAAAAGDKAAAVEAERAAAQEAVKAAQGRCGACPGLPGPGGRVCLLGESLSVAQLQLEIGSRLQPSHTYCAPLPTPRFEVELQSLRMRLAAEHQMQLDRADAGGAGQGDAQWGSQCARSLAFLQMLGVSLHSTC